jgi:hypothetical protein
VSWSRWRYTCCPSHTGIGVSGENGTEHEPAAFHSALRLPGAASVPVIKYHIASDE